VNSIDRRDKQGIKLLEWIFIIFAVGFYPMLVSIYPLLPPLIGIAGLVMMRTINSSVIYPLSAMLYLVHLDLNLALPFMLSVFSIIFINMFIYPSAKLVIRCKVCLNIFIILFVDGFYYMSLFMYDIIFDVKTIIADSVLGYYILFDMIIGLLI
jgi:hypothetical protein